MKNKKKLLKSSVLITSSLVSIFTSAGISSAFLSKKINNSTSFSESYVSNTSNKLEQFNQNNSNNIVKPLVPLEFNTYMPILSSPNGPIGFWNSKIIAMDWFGAERWSFDTSKYDVPGRPKYIDRPFLNWAYDFKNNYILVLMSTTGNKPHKILALSADTGEIAYQYDTSYIPANNYQLFYFIQVLANGNVVVYGNGGQWDGRYEIYNPKNGQKSGKTSNTSNSNKLNTAGGSSGQIRINNIIPIDNNINLLSVVRYGTGADGVVSVALVDDDLNFINNSNYLSEWNDKFYTLVTPKSGQSFPNKAFYPLVDGRIVAVIFDTVFIFDPSFVGKEGFIKTYKLDYDVKSYSFDVNENLYFMYDSEENQEIQKLVLPKKGMSNFAISKYYDLKNSSLEAVKKHAKDFVLWNVYGYNGQIMLMNTFKRLIPGDGNVKPQIPLPSKEQIQENKYGLAVAVSNNKSNPTNGDIKGLLNSDGSFLKSADFTIDSQVLSKKVPSEITRNDLTLLQDSFLTKNTTKNPDGTLTYEPFKKLNVNDQSKTLKIEVNLDQIPWFVTDGKMPSNIKPLKVSKDFTSSVELNTKFSWKEIENDYNFKNTLPTKLDLSYVNELDPLITSLTSQKVRINGDEYPKKTYSLSNADDTAGTIKIKVEYKYLPLDMTVNQSNLLTYTTEKEFGMFKSTDTKQIKFIGGDERDIGKIPELKEMQEAQILPSSFDSNNYNDLVTFIDVNATKGYPLNKMDITLSPNDTNGTLEIRINPIKYDSSLRQQTKTFTNFNKKSLYTFNFTNLDSSKTLQKIKYKPSEITEELFYDNFVTYTGFNSSDFKLQLFPNDATGNLVANVYLETEYPEDILTKTNFVNKNGKWVNSKTISGFKTDAIFNQEYQFTFKEDLDQSLNNIKYLTPDKVVNSFNKDNNGGLTVTNPQNNQTTTYATKYDLVKNLFMNTKGLLLPEIDSNNTDINLYPNNSGGELTIEIIFKTNIEGYDGNKLSFVQLYSGFAKGNDVTTGDTIALKNNSQLFFTNSNFTGLFPSQIEANFKNDQIKKEWLQKFLVTDPTGDYKKAINNNKYKITIIGDDLYGDLMFNIKFERSEIQNPQSLLEYTEFYTGFRKY